MRLITSCGLEVGRLDQRKTVKASGEADGRILVALRSLSSTENVLIDAIGVGDYLVVVIGLLGEIFHVL